MATTPHTYGRFIGRVGALAVALGVGAAIANSPGISWADGGESSSSGTSSSDSDAGATSDTDAGGGSQPSGAGGATTEASADDDASTDDDDDASADAGDADVDDDADVDAEADDEDQDDASSDDDDDEQNVSSEPGDTDQTSTSSSIDGDSSPNDREVPTPDSKTTDTPTTAAASQVPDESTSEAEDFAAGTDDSPPPSAETASAAPAPQSGEPSTEAITTSLSVQAAPATVSTPLSSGFGGLFSSVLSALGFGSQAANGPTAPPQPPALWAMLAWARREIGNLAAPFSPAAATSAAVTQVETATQVEEVSTTAVSPLGTPEQLAAERLATQIANSLPVAFMKVVLRQGFLAAARQQYPNGLDEQSLAALDKAVDEYAMAASFQQLLLNPLTPTVVTQVAPPHVWFGQIVGGSRILYDNPDTIYRFMGVSASSEYVITGRFHDLTEAGLPADTTFSVLEGLAGTTSTILTADDLEVNDDGTFVITVSTEPANGRKNHLQLTPGSTLIAARDTLGNWNEEEPMSLSIQRVGGPPNSLFAQIGGFTFLGPLVSTNPLLTTLVSLIPPLPYMPPVVRGAFTAVILVVRGVNEQAKYMALASTDPETGEPREPNVLSQPASNAEFLSNQLQSTGNYALADNEVLVLRIDPGTANYFIVPTYDIWTITDDFWNEQTSLNNEQAIANGDGTYTLVISPTDPGAANWVSTGGLNQGAISIRFQDLGPDPNNEDPPRIVDQRVMSHEALRDFLPADDFVTDEERAEQLALRKAGFDKRWAPYPQP